MNEHHFIITRHFRLSFLEEEPETRILCGSVLLRERRRHDREGKKLGKAMVSADV